MRLIDEAVGGGYLVGDALTVADCFLLPHLLFFGRTPEGQTLLAKATHASAWLSRMTNRPSFANSAQRQAFDSFHLPAPTAVSWTTP